VVELELRFVVVFPGAFPFRSWVGFRSREVVERRERC